MSVLDTRLIEANDPGASTIRQYLGHLLIALLTEGEGFSGKRPFGNSGWDWDLIDPLIVTRDEEGWPNPAPGEAEAAIKQVIEAVRAEFLEANPS